VDWREHRQSRRVATAEAKTQAGAAEIGGAVRPLAGPLKPGLSGGIEDVPLGIPDDDIPVDGKLRLLDGLPLMGNTGAAGVEV
jgi:hypothetical protein